MRRDGRTVAKAELATKTCVACGRPMIWRKRWAKDWDAVKFCSERCRSGPPSPTRLPAQER